MAEEGRAESVERDAEPRWGLLMPLLTAGFCPAKTARRTDHFSGYDAIAVHLLALALLVLAVTGAIYWRGGPAILGFDSPGQCLAPLAMIIILYDLLYVLLGLVMAPWGAGRERLRTSFGRSVRRTLRHTPHLLHAFLLAGLLAIPCFLAHARHRETYQDDVRRVVDELTERGIDGVSFGVWQRAREIVEGRRPFYAKHGDELGTIFYFAGGLWFFGGLLSAIGAAPLSEKLEDRPPTCEDCGYNLTGLSMEGRCPECGLHILESLGPDARPGTPWQQGAPLGRWDAFWSTTGSALFRPTATGRRILAQPKHGDHRSLVWIWAGVVFAIVWIGGLLSAQPDTGIMIRRSGPLIWQFLGMLNGVWAVVGMIVFASIAAMLVGLWASWRDRCNMLPFAMQAAGAAAAALPAGLLVELPGAGFLTIVGSFLARQGFVGGASRSFVFVLLEWGPQIVFFLVYLWLIARIVRGARFSNQ